MTELEPIIVAPIAVNDPVYKHTITLITGEVIVGYSTASWKPPNTGFWWPILYDEATSSDEGVYTLSGETHKDTRFNMRHVVMVNSKKMP